MVDPFIYSTVNSGDVKLQVGMRIIVLRWTKNSKAEGKLVALGMWPKPARGQTLQYNYIFRVKKLRDSIT